MVKKTSGKNHANLGIFLKSGYLYDLKYLLTDWLLATREKTNNSRMGKFG